MAKDETMRDYNPKNTLITPSAGWKISQLGDSVTMRILSQEERRQATKQPAGTLPEPSKRPFPPCDQPLDEYAEIEETIETIANRHGGLPFDLAKVSRFLELSAMRDEAETFHKLFPGEREAWMPTEVLAQLLAVDSTGTEGRTLIRRLWQARAAVLTIEFEPIHGGGESQATMERWRLTLFFYTGSLMECFA